MDHYNQIYLQAYNKCSIDIEKITFNGDNNVYAAKFDLRNSSIIIRSKAGYSLIGDRSGTQIAALFENTEFYAGETAIYIPDAYEFVFDFIDKAYKIVPRFDTNNDNYITLLGANLSVNGGFLFGLLYDNYQSIFTRVNLNNLLIKNEEIEDSLNTRVTRNEILNMADYYTLSFTKDDMRVGSYQSSSMTVANGYNYAICPLVYIKLAPYAKVTINEFISNENNNLKVKYRLGRYDENKNYLRQTAVTESNTYIMAADEYYLGIGLYYFNSDGTEYNNNVLDLVQNDYDTVAEVVTSLLIEKDSNKYLKKQSKTIEVNIEDMFIGSIQLSTHSVAYFVGDISTKNYFPTEYGKQYTIKIDTPNNNIYYKYRNVFYDIDKNPVKQNAIILKNTINIDDERIKYFDIGIYANYIDTNTTVDSSSDDRKFILKDALLNNGINTLTLEIGNEYKEDYISQEEMYAYVNNKFANVVTNDSDIISLNKNMLYKILNASRPINITSFGYRTQVKPFSLLHFSDIHGDYVELQRIQSFINEYQDYIDDAICTGDLVAGRWKDDFTYFGNYSNGKILTVVGNHDVLAPDTGWDWSDRKSQADQYARYMEPFIENWNCQYAAGLTYYYKDYTEKTIRLIVLNCMLTEDDNTNQLAWFRTVLQDAYNKNLNVIAVNHFPLAYTTKINSNFTSIDKNIAGYDANNYIQQSYQQAVKEFKDYNGSFICWIAGHTHTDYITTGQGDYSNQLCIIVDCLNRTQGDQYSDMSRTDGQISQDLANLYFFDTTIDCVKVIRIGANLDHHLRSKNSITINYKTLEIVQQN